MREPTTCDTINWKVAVFAETLWTEIAVFGKCLISWLVVQVATIHQTTRLTALYPVQPAWAGTRKNFIHLLPILVGSISSISSIDYSPQNPLSTTSNHVFFGLLLYLTPPLCNLCSFHWLHTQQQPFYDPLSGTTRVSRYQKKHSPTHHPDHPIFISFFHLPQSIASSLFKLRAWQSFCTTSLPLGLDPPPHIPYISSPNQCLLFNGYCRTNNNRRDKKQNKKSKNWNMV